MPRKILLVEDSQTQQAEIVYCLKEIRLPDCDIVAASTAEEGLALAQAGGFDVLLLDLYLPDSGAEKTLDTFRVFMAKVPTIVVTGASGWAKKAIDAGAYDCIKKDTIDTADRLAIAIDRAIEAQKQKTESLKIQENVAQVKAQVQEVVDAVKAQVQEAAESARPQGGS